MPTTVLTATPTAPPTYNPSMADTFSWVPVSGAGRPLYARATYLANASDISVSLSAGDLNIYLDEVETKLDSIISQVDVLDENTEAIATTNFNLSSQLGLGGFVAIKGGETAIGNFSTVQVFSACLISDIAVSNSTVGPLTAVELPVGFTFNGPINSITLSYGAVIVYKL